MSAKSFGECIGHSTTDDQSINLVKKVIDNRDLAGNFSSTKDSYEWSFRIFYCISKECNFFFHQVSNYSCFNIFGNTNVGAVCSVSCTKCIIYKYITKGSKFFAELISVLCFFCTVTCIFKKDNFSVFHFSYCCFYSIINNYRARNEFNFLSKKFCETLCNWCK